MKATDALAQFCVQQISPTNNDIFSQKAALFNCA